ncbi:SETD4 [Bugula neritina]|uniref:SETD4 n=1 Tax=Bugula neritina TaxID=10212 RepID=A0A7J7JN98_BUGNE|nr:SETD4 [Bugula neritina]
MGRTYRKRHRQSKRSVSDKGGGYELSDLAQFCAAHGCQEVKRLRTYNFDGCGRGMQTLSRIQPGDALIRLPQALLVTTSTALKDDIIRSMCQRSTLKPTAVEMLCAFLLYERQKGEKSFWRYYITSLPTSFSTLLCLNPKDAHLLDSQLQTRLDTMQRSVDRTFSETVKIFGELLGDVSYSDYLWAWHVVNTRCIYMKQPKLEEVRTSNEEEDDFALAPFLDLLNHNPSAQSSILFDDEAGFCEIVTHDTYRKYDQVFIRYDNHSNRTLLLEYGFCISEKLDEVVELNMDILTEYVLQGIQAEPFMEKIEDWKLTKGLLCDHIEGLSWNALNAIKIMCDASCGAISETVGRLRVLDSSMKHRLSYIEKLSAAKVSVKRSDNEMFILDMLTVLYKGEVAILQHAKQYL